MKNTVVKKLTAIVAVAAVVVTTGRGAFCVKAGAATNWRSLYRQQLNTMADNHGGRDHVKGKLVYLNKDKTPELYLNFGTKNFIYTIAKGQTFQYVWDTETSTLKNAGYVNKKNKIFVTGMDISYMNGYDRIVKIMDGTFKVQENGSWSGDNINRDLMSYYWNNKNVTRTQYGGVVKYVKGSTTYTKFYSKLKSYKELMNQLTKNQPSNKLTGKYITNLNEVTKLSLAGKKYSINTVNPLGMYKSGDLKTGNYLVLKETDQNVLSGAKASGFMIKSNDGYVYTVEQFNMKMTEAKNTGHDVQLTFQVSKGKLKQVTYRIM